jgi:hypothetical protein
LGEVIAEGTRRLLGNLFELEDLVPKDLKGVAGLVRAFDLPGEESTSLRSFTS